jgi:hypothetical protein
MTGRRARVVMCKRCTATTFLDKPKAGWNMVYDKGYLTGYLCPGCQSPEENAEAEINEATVKPTGMDEFGRVWGQRNA